MIVNPIPDILDPALKLLPSMDSVRARMMLLAIGLQESRFEHRRQLGNGPARGFWQFESGGGVRVLPGSVVRFRTREDEVGIDEYMADDRLGWAMLCGLSGD